MASKRLRDVVGIDPDRVVSAALEAALGEVEQPRKKRHPGRVLVAGAALAAAATVGQRRMPRMARLPLRMGLNKLGDMAHVDELADALHDRADALHDRADALHDRLVGHDDDVDDADADVADDEDEEEFDEAEPVDDDAEEDFDDEGDEGDDEGPDDDEDLDDDDFDDGPEDDDGPRDEGEGDELDPEDDEEPDDDSEDEIPEDEEPEEELPEDDEPEEPEDEDLPPEEEDDDEDEDVAARGLDLGALTDGDRAPKRDRAPARDRGPDLFETLRTRPRRAPVMRRGSRRVDPAVRPPEPGAARDRDDRRASSGPTKPRGSTRKSKPKTARA